MNIRRESKDVCPFIRRQRKKPTSNTRIVIQQARFYGYDHKSRSLSWGESESDSMKMCLTFL